VCHAASCRLWTCYLLTAGSSTICCGNVVVVAELSVAWGCCRLCKAVHAVPTRTSSKCCWKTPSVAVKHS
jgi:hypothetical protein